MPSRERHILSPVGQVQYLYSKLAVLVFLFPIPLLLHCPLLLDTLRPTTMMAANPVPAPSISSLYTPSVAGHDDGDNVTINSTFSTNTSEVHLLRSIRSLAESASLLSQAGSDESVRTVKDKRSSRRWSRRVSGKVGEGMREDRGVPLLSTFRSFTSGLVLFLNVRQRESLAQRESIEVAKGFLPAPLHEQKVLMDKLLDLSWCVFCCVLLSITD